MAGLRRHTRTTDPEEHAKLAFRADCPRCQVRRVGRAPAQDVLPVGATASLAAGVLLASGMSAAPAEAQAPAAEIDPPAEAVTGGPPSPAPIEPEIDPPRDSATGGQSPSIEPPSASGGSAQESSADGDRAGGRSTEPNARGGAGEHSDGERAVDLPGPVGATWASGERPQSDRAPRPQGEAKRGRRDREQLAGPRDGAGSSPRSTAGGRGSRRGTGNVTASRYVIQAGDSLWGIAARRVGARASAAHTAREVKRLWERNAAAIGTGDPDVIRPGQLLRL